MVEAREEAYASLRRRFKGDLLRPGESGYETRVSFGMAW